MTGRFRNKQARGLGSMIEVPAAIYGFGIAFGLLDPDARLITYLLPADEPDVTTAYRRAAWDTKTGDYCLLPERTPFPVERVAASVPFLRGLTRSAEIEAVSEGRDGEWPAVRAQIFSQWLGRLAYLVGRDGDWTLTLTGWLVERPEWMIAAATSGAEFRWIEAAHEQTLPRGKRT